MSRPDLTDDVIDKVLFVTPQDMIGEVIDFGGTKGRLTSIIGSGAEVIVFEITNVDTGEANTVAKIPRESFDPRLVFSRETKSAMDRSDWDRIVRLAERFLVRFPESEEAAFNKGMGHIARHEFESAAAAFDLAISLNPGDILNWTYKASASAKLDRSDDLLAALLICEEINARSFREFMAPRREMADELRNGLRKIPRGNTHHRTAQRLLKTLLR